MWFVFVLMYEVSRQVLLATQFVGWSGRRGLQVGDLVDFTDVVFEIEKMTSTT